MGFANGAYYFTSVVFLWNLFFFDAVRLSVASGVMSTWYFFDVTHDADLSYSSAKAVYVFAGNAAGPQLGTLAVASLFTAAIGKLRQWARASGCFACCPHTLLAKMVLCVLVSVTGFPVESLSRFAVAYSTVTGYGFWRSVSGSFKLCVKNFGDAITNELTATVVLNLGTLVLSALVGFLAYMGAALVQHVPPFVFPDILPPDLGLDFFEYLLRTLMFGFSGWVAYNTLLGIFLLVLFPVIWTATLGDEVWMGVLCMLIARLIFSFFSGMLMDATTGCFLCAAIDKDRGIVSSKLHLVEGISREAGFELDSILRNASAPPRDYEHPPPYDSLLPQQYYTPTAHLSQVQPQQYAPYQAPL
jgi:hypothetical protein